MVRNGFGRKGFGFVIALIAALVATTGKAFTASNTSLPHRGGMGMGTVSGYEVRDVRYTLNSADPTKIDAVSFTVSPITASQVKVRLASEASAWYACTNRAGSVSCTTTSPQARVSTADALTVVATR